MRNYRRLRPLMIVVAAVALLAGGALAGFAQSMSPTTSIVGRIDSIVGSNITLILDNRTPATVTLEPTTLILSRQLASVADVKAGEALGVAAVRGSDGSLTATVVNIFSPELWTAARKGQWPMSNGQVMTNAQVTNVALSVQGGTLTMGYQDGTATIMLPEGVQVHRIVTVKPQTLQVGQRVAIRGTEEPDGSVAAASVSFDQVGG